MEQQPRGRLSWGDLACPAGAVTLVRLPLAVVFPLVVYNTELALADLETVERALQRAAKAAKSGDKAALSRLVIDQHQQTFVLIGHEPPQKGRTGTVPLRCRGMHYPMAVKTRLRTSQTPTRGNGRQQCLENAGTRG